MSAIPHALQLAESVNSEFFAPIGNALITSPEAEDLLHTYYLPSVRQHPTAFDGDNTAAQPTHQRPAGAAPLALLHRLRLRGNYFALAGFTSGSWRYRPAACAQSITRIILIRRSHAIRHSTPRLSPRTGRSAGPLPIPPRHSAPLSAETSSYLACGM